VAVQKRTEKQQKDFIFDIFTKCCNETVSTRLQVYYPLLCEQIYRWYKDYLSIDVDKMGLEIANVINRIIKNDNISIPQDKDGFFKYLNASIKTEKASFHREYNEDDAIKIPKDKKRKLKEVKDFILMKESQLGRKLTNDERMQCVLKWFKKQEYVDLLNAVNVGSISPVNDDNEEMDVLNFIDTNSENPLDEYIARNDMETILKAVKSLLDEKKDRNRDCYKELFTLYCVKKGITGLYPILDQKIINDFHKDGKKPTQYEIYLKYHPDADKKGAEAMASVNLKEFINDIKKYIKEKIYKFPLKNLKFS